MIDTEISKFGLQARHYRCFGDDPQGFDSFKQVNLIIGRNNTGKSALLDVIRYAVEGLDPPRERSGDAATPAFSFLRTLCLDDFQAFPQQLTDEARRALAMAAGDFAGKKVRLGLPARSTPREYGSVEHVDIRVNDHFAAAFHAFAMNLPNPFAGKSFRLLAAERDMKPETQASHGETLELKSDGTGATRAVEFVLNSNERDSVLVEDVLLGDLNEIMGPDATFTRIGVQRLVGERWTVVLDEKGKGRIPLEHSGSGLKTILLVLVNLLIEPVLADRPVGRCVFAFEELENYVHPGLQRRLLEYIDRKAREGDFLVFLTTHSPAIIDLFADKEHAQVVHVTHDGMSAECCVAGGLAAGHRVLDDLDVRASDLLQSNGVVWVEGISDRIYIKKWLQLLCQEIGVDSPVEGTEYAFLEYGGKCLSHYDFGCLDVKGAKDKDLGLLIPALRISRNHFVVMDSDLSSGKSPLRQAKQEVIDATPSHWVTDGREVENYLCNSIARTVFGSQLNRWEPLGKKGRRIDKRAAAERAESLLALENWERFELRDHVTALLTEILRWNGRTADLAKLASSEEAPASNVD